MRTYRNMDHQKLSEKEQKILHTIFPHIEKLLQSLGHTDTVFTGPDDPFLLGAIEYTKKGACVRKKFGEHMVIFSFPELFNNEGNILRIFCIVDKEGDFLDMHHNYISKEQADLLKGE